MKWNSTLSQVVLKHGIRLEEKEAVCVGNKSTTYGQLAHMMLTARAKLQESGVGRGDMVMISAVMKAEYIAAFLAIKDLRAVAVPVNRTASLSEAALLLECTEAKLFLTDHPGFRELEQTASLLEVCRENNTCNSGNLLHENTPEWEEIEGSELSEILFTSGTTGKPKGVMLSQEGLLASIYNTSTGIGMKTSDILLLPLPLNHSFGLRVLRSALYQGETIVLQNGFTFAGEMQKNINLWHCNCMAVVSAGLERIRQQAGDGYIEMLKGMRYLEFSAGAVPVPMRKRLIRDLPGTILHNTWGSTETGGALFLDFSVRQDKIESAGRAINDIGLAIVDEEGQPVKENSSQIGRLVIRSAARMLGYFKEPELTQETLHGEWLYTNDAACIDQDGYVYLNGRIDDMISVGGEKVAPAAVEQICLGGQDEILECACCGVKDPDDVLGEVPVLFVVTQTGSCDEKRLREKIRQKGNGYMVPAGIYSVTELPRNYMGKIDRKRLREMGEENLDKERQQEKCADKLERADEILSLICTRRSIRTFQEKPIQDEQLEMLLTAARMAPSGHNMQTWRFTVLRRKEHIQQLKEITRQTAAEKGSLFYGFQNPQVLIIVSNDRRNPDSLQDSSCAIENILLMAHALSLGACWLNSWIAISDEPSVRALFTQYGIPGTHIVHGVVGIGYPAGEVKTPVKKQDVVRYYDS